MQINLQKVKQNCRGLYNMRCFMEISCASQVNMVKHGHIIQPSTIVLYGNFWCFIFPANVINHLIIRQWHINMRCREIYKRSVWHKNCVHWWKILVFWLGIVIREGIFQFLKLLLKIWLTWWLNFRRFL